MKPINLHEYEALARERMDPTGDLDALRREMARLITELQR